MNYLALGDSISIDDYTGVAGGGAASQFAKLTRAVEFQNLTRDGCTTEDLFEALDEVALKPDIVTLTICGNDFLEGASRLRSGAVTMDDIVGTALENLDRICGVIAAYHCPAIVNTIYDPTDGDDRIAAAIGLPPTLRQGFDALNEGIRDAAKRHGFLLCDLEALFHGHGAVSADPWIVSDIEPNLAGATAIAQAWRDIALAPAGGSPFRS